MLNMKHTWKAVMTLGLALLLGPMMAQAERVNLSGGTADGLGPLTYAQETLSATANTTTGRWAVEIPTEAFQIAVKPRRAINATEEVYLRIDLTGARFGGAPSLEQGPLLDGDGELTTTNLAAGLTETISSGGAGQTFAVLKIGEAGTGADVAAANAIAVVISTTPSFEAGGDLQLTSGGVGSVSATIAAYTNPDDALDQVNPRSTFGGSGTIVRVVSGLAVTIDAADSGDAGASNAVASVDHGFLWFVGPMGQAKLGWLGIEANAGATAGIRTAVTGAALATDGTEILPAGSQVEYHISGNMDIGAFSLIDDPMYDPTPGAASSTTGCPGATATAGSPDRGTLRGADGMLLVSEDGELPSGVDMASSGNLAPNETTGTRARLLCVNVDVMGPATNMNPIPEGDYSVTAFTKLSATAMGRMVAEGDLASISHNGASVQIPYLTTSEKHNQRLIVVNRGSRPAGITSIRFTSEDGTEVELMDTVQALMEAGELMVAAGETWVASINKTLNITGESRRVSASIAFAATAGHLSVATTQVNLSDGSTDTVVYDVN